MSQKDTILDVLRRVQVPLEAQKRTKSDRSGSESESASTETDDVKAARRPPQERQRRSAHGVGMNGLQRFGRWLAGEFSVPRAGLYMGILVSVLLAFGAYKIGVRKGGFMGDNAYGRNKQLPFTAPMHERDRNGYTRNTVTESGVKRDQGQRDQGQRDQATPAKKGGQPGDHRLISQGPKKGPKKDPKLAQKSGPPLGREPVRSVGDDKPITVLRLTSGPDNAGRRRTLEAMRDWLRHKLSQQASGATRSVQVYTWMSESSRKGAPKSACLEASVPKAWSQTPGRLVDVLASFGSVSESDFSFSFRNLRNSPSWRMRRPSEIDGVLQKEQPRR